MLIDMALIEEQGVKFAVVPIKQHFFHLPQERENFRNKISENFPKEIPIILISKNYNGDIVFNGRHDIVVFLSNIDPKNLPWKKYYVKALYNLIIF